MKSHSIRLTEILSHPTAVLSAEYWVNIKEGKLPFSKQEDGTYVCSHTKNLNNAIYMTEEEAKELNIAVKELKAAIDLVNNLLKKHT